MRSRKSSGLLTIAAAIAAGVVLATPASATTVPPDGSWDHTYTSDEAAHGATVYIEEYNDIVKLCDSAPDGLAPHVQLWVWTNTNSAEADFYDDLTVTGGYGSCVEASASDGATYDNLPENKTINVDIYTGNDVGWHEYSYLNDH